MQITITARHFDLADAHKHHAEQEIKRLGRYFDHILSTDLTLIHEKYRYTVEMTMQVDGAVLTSKEEAADVYAAIDQAAVKMERQLKKYKDKLQNHRVKRNALAETIPTEPSPE
ncbi:MAG: ribosome-associated translation inhibitor RaiA [Candidatus Latescibacteria bacterium]|nr:ribosome-associated translation inhibitor RaiA [Candidatus Latescibacterota bacterium]